MGQAQLKKEDDKIKIEETTKGWMKISVNKGLMEKAWEEFKAKGNFLDSFKELVEGKGLTDEAMYKLYRDMHDYLETMSNVNRISSISVEIPLVVDVNINYKVDTSVSSIEEVLPLIIEQRKNGAVTLTKKGKEYDGKKYEEEMKKNEPITQQLENYSEVHKRMSEGYSEILTSRMSNDYERKGNSLSSEIKKLSNEIMASSMSDERKLKYLSFLSIVENDKSWALYKIARDIFYTCNGNEQVEKKKLIKLAATITEFLQPQTGHIVNNKTVSFMLAPSKEQLGLEPGIMYSLAALTRSGMQKPLYGAGGALHLGENRDVDINVRLGNILSGSVGIFRGDMAVGLTTLQVIKTKNGYDLLFEFGRVGGTEGLIKVPLSTIRSSPGMLAIPAVLSGFNATVQAAGVVPYTTQSLLVGGVLLNTFYPPQISTLRELFNLFDYSVPDVKKRREPYENFESLKEAEYMLSEGKTNEGLAIVDGVLASSKGAMRGYAQALEDEGIMQETVHLRLGESPKPGTAINKKIVKHMEKLNKTMEVLSKDNLDEFLESYTYLMTKYVPYINGKREFVFPLYLKNKKELVDFVKTINTATYALRKLIFNNTSLVNPKEKDNIRYDLTIISSIVKLGNPIFKLNMAREFMSGKSKEWIDTDTLNYLKAVSTDTVYNFRSIAEYGAMEEIDTKQLNYYLNMKGKYAKYITANKFLKHFMDIGELANTLNNSQIYQMVSTLKRLENTQKKEKYENEIKEWMIRNFEIKEQYDGSEQVVFSVSGELKLMKDLLAKRENDIEKVKKEKSDDDKEINELFKEEPKLPLKKKLKGLNKQLVKRVENLYNQFKNGVKPEVYTVLLNTLESMITETDGLSLATKDKDERDMLDDIKEYLTKRRDGLKKCLDNMDKLAYMEYAYKEDKDIYERAVKLYEDAKGELKKRTPVKKIMLTPTPSYEN